MTEKTDGGPALATLLDLQDRLAACRAIVTALIAREEAAHG